MKLDLHCHSYYSNDGVSSPEKIIKQALARGLDGVAITDHETSAGWQEALEAGRKLGAQIVLGEEIKTKQGDVLALFIQEQINGKGKDARLVMEEIKKQDGLVIIPHPYHSYEKFKGEIKNYLDLIDGVEILNARLPLKSPDKTAFEFAKGHNLAVTAGSDAHFYKGVGKAYTECDAETLEEFKAMLQNKKSVANGEKASLLYLIFPTLKRLKLVNSKPRF